MVKKWIAFFLVALLIVPSFSLGEGENWKCAFCGYAYSANFSFHPMCTHFQEESQREAELRSSQWVSNHCGCRNMSEYDCTRCGQSKSETEKALRNAQG